MFIFFNVLTDHNQNKYITTPEFNKFTVEVVDAKSAKANLITKTDFDTKLINIEKPANIWFNLLKGKSRFEEDGVQKYLVF